MTSKSDKQFQYNKQSATTGILYIVATPIGNLKDITYRAVDTLNSADLILCENPKNSKKLLNYYGINTKCYTYNDHSDEKQRNMVMSKLLEGKKVCLISDAGTPLISDPGYKLVKYIADHGIRIEPIPGPSSTVTAMSASGLPTDRFLFRGFLSNQKSKVEKELEELSKEIATLVLFESPKRIYSTVGAIQKVLGERDIVIARELTKMHEEFIRTTPQNFLEQYKDHEFKWEIVLLISGNTTQEDEVDVDTMLAKLMKDHSTKDAVEIVSKTFDLSKKEVYKRALELMSGE